MKNRFGGQFDDDCTRVAEMTELINSQYKTPATRQKHIAERADKGLHTIRSYAEDVARIARYVSE